MKEFSTPERNEHILVDFDLTLFNTGEFAHDLWEEMAVLSGKSYAETLAEGNSFHLDPVLGGYDFNAHIDACGLDRDLLWKKVDELVGFKDYLYPDSAPFIHKLQHASFDTSILSFGEEHFQAAKIVPVLGQLAGTDGNTNNPLPYEVVFRKKGLYIAETYPGETGVLVDDVPNQDLPDGFVEIHLDRKSGLESPQEKIGGFVVANLDQAYDVIRTLYG